MSCDNRAESMLDEESWTDACRTEEKRRLRCAEPGKEFANNTQSIIEKITKLSHECHQIEEKNEALYAVLKWFATINLRPTIHIKIQNTVAAREKKDQAMWR